MLYVAPFTGAWIEIVFSEHLSYNRLSLPSRERGLKLKILNFLFFLKKSLPSRERGLKSEILDPQADID